MYVCGIGPACYRDVPGRCQAVRPEPVPIGCESLSFSHVYSSVRPEPVPIGCESLSFSHVYSSVTALNAAAVHVNYHLSLTWTHQQYEREGAIRRWTDNICDLTGNEVLRDVLVMEL